MQEAEADIQAFYEACVRVHAWTTRRLVLTTKAELGKAENDALSEPTPKIQVCTTTQKRESSSLSGLCRCLKITHWLQKFLKVQWNFWLFSHGTKCLSCGLSLKGPTKIVDGQRKQAAHFVNIEFVHLCFGVRSAFSERGCHWLGGKRSRGKITAGVYFKCATSKFWVFFWPALECHHGTVRILVFLGKSYRSCLSLVWWCLGRDWLWITLFCASFLISIEESVSHVSFCGLSVSHYMSCCDLIPPVLWVTLAIERWTAAVGVPVALLYLYLFCSRITRWHNLFYQQFQHVIWCVFRDKYRFYVHCWCWFCFQVQLFCVWNDSWLFSSVFWKKLGYIQNCDQFVFSWLIRYK